MDAQDDVLNGRAVAGSDPIPPNPRARSRRPTDDEAQVELYVELFGEFLDKVT
ncbi:MAG: hypothetical protein ACXVH3_21950 [Solirubrobacteraceae bacterium]